MEGADQHRFVPEIERVPLCFFFGMRIAVKVFAYETT